MDWEKVGRHLVDDHLVPLVDLKRWPERRAIVISPAGRQDSVPTASAMRTQSWSSWPLMNVWSVLGTSMTFCDWKGMFA